MYDIKLTKYKNCQQKYCQLARCLGQSLRRDRNKFDRVNGQSSFLIMQSFISTKYVIDLSLIETYLRHNFPAGLQIQQNKIIEDHY